MEMLKDFGLWFQGLTSSVTRFMDLGLGVYCFGSYMRL